MAAEKTTKQSKRKRPAHPMPDDPKALAKALFWEHDQKVKDRRRLQEAKP